MQSICFAYFAGKIGRTFPSKLSSSFSPPTATLHFRFVIVLRSPLLLHHFLSSLSFACFFLSRYRLNVIVPNLLQEPHAFKCELLPRNTHNRMYCLMKHIAQSDGKILHYVLAVLLDFSTLESVPMYSLTRSCFKAPWRFNHGIFHHVGILSIGNHCSDQSNSPFRYGIGALGRCDTS
jgi:hypothetical protein